MNATSEAQIYHWVLRIMVIAILVISTFIRVLKKHERGLVIVSGKSVRVLGPGLVFLIPGVHKMKKIDTRLLSEDTPWNVTVDGKTIVVIKKADKAITARLSV